MRVTCNPESFRMENPFNCIKNHSDKPLKMAFVLIAGAMAPGCFWTDEFCHIMATDGCLVIRYDHRDIGLSSCIDWQTASYTLLDLATDVISINDTPKNLAEFLVEQ